MKKNSQGPINFFLKDYFTEVQPYSSEHLSDIARFNRLLENMQDFQKSSDDRRAFAEIGSRIRDLNSFLVRYDVTLNTEEEREIAAIAGLKLSPASSRERIDNMISRIKRRAEAEIVHRREKESFNSEIRELGYSRIPFIDWLKVTKWALDYGTISIFSHRLRRTCLAGLQKRAYELICSLVKGVRPVLDQEYYMLSVLEYNSIEMLLQVQKSLERIRNVPVKDLYSSMDITEEMDDFSTCYITLVKNASLTEKALKKAFKKHRAPHGFWGDFYEFMGSPLLNSRPLKLTEYERITGTPGGVLFSHYTCHFGVVVRTINQVAFICDVSGSLDSGKKRLTAGALQNARVSAPETGSSDSNMLNRREELERIVSRYIPLGEQLAEKLISGTIKISQQQWKRECDARPMLRIKKIVEDFIHQYIEPLAAKSIMPVYDNREYGDYFEKLAQVANVVKTYTLMDFELVGTKEKDFTYLQLPHDSSAKQLIYTLTRLEIPKASYDSRMALAQSVLTKISNASYQLALVLNDITKRYYETQKDVQPDVTKNFDFFIGSILRAKGQVRIPALNKKENTTLAEFLEGACSLAFYISDYLNHEGVDAARKERDMLAKEIDEAGTASTGLPYQAEVLKAEEADSDLLGEIDALYRDPLTRLYTFRYFEEQVRQKFYDDQMRYRMAESRIVFLFQVDDLMSLNETWGHDVGDAVLVEVSRILGNLFPEQGPGAINGLLFRYEGGAVLGYVNDRSLTSVVDLVAHARKEINSLEIRDQNGNDVGTIVIKAGLYQERKGTIGAENIKIADKILRCANRGRSNMIGFQRDQNRIVTEKDFDINGEINVEIVSVI